MNLEEFKSSFPKTTSWIHLNNAGLALPTAPAKAVVQNWLERFQTEGAHCGPAFLQAMEEARVSLAALVGCKPQELGFFQSTSGAVSQVAFGMDLKPGDEILTWDQEYPSNSLPWKAAAERTGARLIRVASAENLVTPVEKLISAITERTKVIAISWVQYQTGAITDLQKLSVAARARNIWTVVDVIQGLGQLPFDFQASGLDAVCGGSHKWMLSFVGVGFLAVREERLKQLRPLMVGTETFQHSHQPEAMYKNAKEAAAKFEPGSKQFLEIAALGASADFIRRVSVEAIAAEIHSRAQYLRAGLKKLGCNLHCPHGENPQGAIVNFSRGDLQERSRIEDLFKKNSISYVQRDQGLRLSPHVYTSEADLDFVFSLLKEKL
jgi:selenocysteine lyase/cysteine desulfurase